MPNPISLDTKRWTRVVPTGRSQTVKCLNFACYYSNAAEPPELASEGTELGASSTVTIETPSGKWFRAKEPSSSEAPYQPSILEVQAPNPESTGTPELGAESVTEAKIASEAVAPGKSKHASTTGIEFSTTEKAGTELGTTGVTRTVLAYACPKHEAHAKVTIKHNLGNEYATVVGLFALSSKKASKQLTPVPLGTWLKVIEAKSANEIEVEFEKEPGSKEELVFVVQG